MCCYIASDREHATGDILRPDASLEKLTRSDGWWLPTSATPSMTRGSAISKRDDRRRVNLGQGHQARLNGIRYVAVDGDCRQCLAPLSESRLVVLGDVDPSVAEERADATDHAGHVAVGDDDQTLTGRYID